MFFAPSKSSERAKIRHMVVQKTSDHIKINIRMPNSSQEPPASSKAPNEDLKDMDVLCTFKIRREPKFRICVYQRPATISKSISGCQTTVKNLQHPPNPQMRT